MSSHRLQETVRSACSDPHLLSTLCLSGPTLWGKVVLRKLCGEGLLRHLKNFGHAGPRRFWREGSLGWTPDTISQLTWANGKRQNLTLFMSTTNQQNCSCYETQSVWTIVKLLSPEGKVKQVLPTRLLLTVNESTAFRCARSCRVRSNNPCVWERRLREGKRWVKVIVLASGFKLAEFCSWQCFHPNASWSIYISCNLINESMDVINMVSFFFPLISKTAITICVHVELFLKVSKVGTLLTW